jgi:hypothetical protein
MGEKRRSREINFGSINWNEVTEISASHSGEYE